jgi:hypothetical protein
MPLRAALSSVLQAWRAASSAASKSPCSIKLRDLFIWVRADTRNTRLRSRLRSELRIRFLADAVFAN